MTKAEHLTHARHNEKACRYVSREGNLNDWVITTAFYSALHYVSYRIFPYDMYDQRGRQTLILHLDKYHAVYSAAPNKHQSLLNLVDENCNEIIDAYDWLYSTCMTARYRKYNQPGQYAVKAMQYLDEVRDYCITN